MNTLKYGDFSQMITLLVDEVPSITLSLLLARCREVPISYYQLAKAALTMFGSAFRYRTGNTYTGKLRVSVAVKLCYYSQIFPLSVPLFQPGQASLDRFRSLGFEDCDFRCLYLQCSSGMSGLGLHFHATPRRRFRASEIFKQ